MPQTPHVEKHFTAGEIVRDVVIGMADELDRSVRACRRAFGRDYAGFNAIKMLFWSAVLNGVLAPPLIIIILFVCNNRRVMRARQRQSIKYARHNRCVGNERGGNRFVSRLAVCVIYQKFLPNKKSRFERFRCLVRTNLPLNKNLSITRLKSSAR